MFAVTLSELQARTRELADMETLAPGSAFVDDAELTRALNRALRQLYNKLVIQRGDDYYAKTSTTQTTAGVPLVALPEDFFQLLTVIVSDGTGAFVDAPKFGVHDVAGLRTSENMIAGGIYLYRYRLNAAGLELLPTPRAAHDVTLYYVPTCPELKLAGDTFDGVNGWEDWACYAAAIDLLNKEESFEQAAALAAARGNLDVQIQALAGTRDAGRPESVQDTRLDWASTRAFARRNDWRL